LCTRHVLATHAYESARHSSTAQGLKEPAGDWARNTRGRHLVNEIVAGFTQTKRLEAGEGGAKPQVNLRPAVHTPRASRASFSAHTPQSPKAIRKPGNCMRKGTKPSAERMLQVKVCIPCPCSYRFARARARAGTRHRHGAEEASTKGERFEAIARDLASTASERSRSGATRFAMAWSISRCITAEKCARKTCQTKRLSNVQKQNTSVQKAGNISSAHYLKAGVDRCADVDDLERNVLALSITI